MSRTERTASAHLPDIDAASHAERATDEPALPSRFGQRRRLDAAVDPHLVQETKQQIQRLVHEIANLAQSGCSLPEFYDGFLNRLVSALASVGGAIWTLKDDGALELEYQTNLAATRLTETPERQLRHAMLLSKVLASGENTLAPPQSGGAGEGEAANDTDFLLILGVIKLNDRAQGVVEIFQRAGGGSTTHRGYLRFVSQMCDMAGDFLKNRSLKNYNDREALWEQLEQFIREAHGSLDLTETIFTIANESKLVIGADRVSLAVSRGGRCVVEAVSGLDTINHRSDEVKRLNRLAEAAVAADQPLWYTGDAHNLPPQIEKALHRYVDSSHAKALAVLPLYKPEAKDARGRGKPQLIGALVIEQLAQAKADEAFVRRATVVARHSAAALANALEHNSLFLMPLWKTLGKATWVVRGRQLPKTLTVVALLVAVVVGLVVTPYKFDLASTGELHPRSRQEVFAGIDGKLIDVPVQAGQWVRQGDVVARLRNAELEVEITRLLGRRRTTQEQIHATHRTLLNDTTLSVQDENRLSGELLQLQKSAENIEQQLELYREKQKQLVVEAPRDGQVVTWQVRENLLHRPVQHGQSLMTVVDPNGPWELELRVRERRMGHINRAFAAAAKHEQPLRVTFVLATHPGQEFAGRVVEVDPQADVRDDEGNTVRVRVAIDETKLPELRDGAKVTAKVHCGMRPLGYSLFHELIETAQAKVLFWL